MRASGIIGGWRSGLVVLTVVATSTGVPVVALAAPERTAVERSAPVRTADRLVWAERSSGLRNLHVRSARADGTGVRRVYDNPRGFTMTLVPDPRGRRVAFVTCCRSDLPLLVVAPTKGGVHLEPLRDHRELEAADGLGWSPDGRSLVFTAIRQVGAARIQSIWTIRLDGTGLREILALGDVLSDDGPGTGSTIAWTRRGIFYTDRGELRRAHDQTSSLVMREVASVRASGDGSRLLLVTGGRERRQLWMARSDGGGARKVAAWRLDGAYAYGDVTPNRDGSRLLAVRFPSTYDSAPDWIAWDVGAGLGSAERLPVDRDADVVAWH